MVKINYGQPVRVGSVRRTTMRRDAFGPGLAVAPTQRVAELGLAANASGRRLR